MKLKIKKAISDGFDAVRNNPNLLLLGFIYFLLVTIYQNYFLNAAQQMAISGNIVPVNLLQYYTLMIVVQLIGMFIYSLMIVLSAKGKKFSLANRIKLVASKYLNLLLAAITFIIVISIPTVIAAFSLSGLAMSPFYKLEIGLMERIALLIIGLAAILFTIYLSLKQMYYGQAVFLDNKGVIDSLKYSWNLTKGNVWQVVGLILFIGAITVIIIIPLYLTMASSGMGLIFLLDFIYFTFLLPWMTATITQSYLQLKRR